MSTDICDFCKRDDGLKIVIGRNSIIAELDINTSKVESFADRVLKQRFILDDDLREKIEDLDSIRSNIVSNNSSVLDSKENNFEQLAEFTHEFDNGMIAEANNLFSYYDAIGDNGNQLKGIKVYATSESYPKGPNFITKEQYGIQAKGENGYIIKTLNPGYLYVYSEHTKITDEYLITEKGFLKKNPDNSNILLASKKEPCFKGDELARSKTITILRPEEATIVWLKYSDTKLNEQQKKKLISKREELMSSFDIRKMINGEKQKNSYLLTQQVYDGLTNFELINHIFNVNEEDGLKKSDEEVDKETDNFKKEMFLSYKEDLKEEEVQELLNDDKKLRIRNGFLVGIDDVTGVVSDLGNLIVGMSSENYLSEQEITAQMVMGIESSIKEQLEELHFKSKSVEDKEKPYFNSNTQDQLDNLDSSNRVQANHIASREWEENYKIHVNTNSLNLNLSNVQKKEALKKQRVEMYGGWCVELLNSKKTLDYFKYCFDDADLDHTAIYIECIAGMLQDSIASSKVMIWLSDKLVSKAGDDNIVVNAFALNNENIKKRLNANIDWRGVLWGDLINTTKSTLEKKSPNFLNGIYKSFHQLVLLSSGTIFAALHGLLDNKEFRVNEFRRPLVMISAITGKEMQELHIKISNNPSVFYDDLARTISNSLKKFGIESDFRKYKNQLYKTNFYQKLRESGKTNYSILSPISKLDDINKSTNIIDIIDSLNRQVYYKFEKIEFSYVFDNQKNIESKFFANSMLNINAGFSSLVHSTNTFFQVLGVLSVMDNIKGSTYGTKYEGISRMVGGFWAITLAAIEAMDVVASRLRSMTTLSLNNNIKFRLVTKNLKAFTLSKNFIKRFPIGIGFLTAGWDVWNGGNDIISSGKRLDGAITVGSGFALLGSVLFISWLPGIGWGLLALGVGLSIIGVSIKEDDMQIWLRRSLLGSQSSFLGMQRYRPFASFDEQQKNWNLNFAK